MDNKIKQLRKGILELALLGVLATDDHYGYSLIKTISEGQPVSINEGTIYPILTRLSKEGLVNNRWVESHQGPPRKYYTITERGRKIYEILDDEFSKLVTLIANSKKNGSSGKKKSSEKKIQVKKEIQDEQ